MNQTLTRADIAAVIVKEIGLSQVESLNMVSDIISHMVTALENHESVKIPHFGTFSTHDTPARLARNPRTKEDAWIESRRVVSFKPSKTLKDRVE